jgi:hypothetical protein
MAGVKLKDFHKLSDVSSVSLLRYIAAAYGYKMADAIAAGVLYDEDVPRVDWPRL